MGRTNEKMNTGKIYRDQLNQNKKNKRKRVLIWKANQLAMDSDLKITLIVQDVRKNTLQEFNSHSDFTVE